MTQFPNGTQLDGKEPIDEENTAMNATYIHEGNGIDYTPAADVAAGEVVVQGELVGITKRDIPAGTLGTLELTGVYDIAKATGASTAIGVGLDVYWDEGNAVATTDSASGVNKRIGRTVAAAADDDEVVRVRMSQ